MVRFPEKEAYDLADLKRLVEILRSPDGCPWDRVQTHETIRRDFLEETYEAVEGIDRDDAALLREELGDVLFQVVFHSVIEEERGRFTLSDVITDVTRKMVERHPHVFKDVSVSGEDAVLANWEQIKNDRKGVASASETLKLVPETFPALMKADKLLKRADKAGAKAGKKAADDLAEAAESFILSEGGEDGEKALGRLLFAVSGAAREKGLDAEMCLLGACKDFVERFEKAEDESKRLERPLSETF